MKDTRGEESENKNAKVQREDAEALHVKVTQGCVLFALIKLTFAIFATLTTPSPLALSHLISLRVPLSPTCSLLIFMLLTSETGMSTQIYYSNYLILQCY